MLLATVVSDFALTVTLQVAFKPFAVLAVIIAVPAFNAVTLPFLSTVATLLLLEYHVTFLTADSGYVEAASVLD